MVGAPPGAGARRRAFMEDKVGDIERAPSEGCEMMDNKDEDEDEADIGGATAEACPPGA